MSYARIALLAGALLLAGCGSSPVVQYYVLAAVPDPAPAAGFGDKTIGVGPVGLPDYLDRPQIVTRPSANTLELADAHRWAHPLGEGVAHALAENLASRLGTDRVLVHPWTRSRRIDYQVTVEVLRFEREPGGTVELVARWAILDRDGATVSPLRRGHVALAASGPGYEALVADQSRTLARLGDDIAEALRGLKP